MDNQTAERIHERIDSTHKLINEVKILFIEQFTAQHKDIENLTTQTKDFIKKVDDTVFHTEEGFIVKTKTKLSGLCTQVKNQWYLITLLLVGVLGIAWEIIKKNGK